MTGGTIRKDQYKFLIVSRSVFLRTKNFSGKFAEKIKTRILCSIAFSQHPCRLWDNVEKYCTAGQTTDGNL